MDLVIRPVEEADAEAVRAFWVRNKDFLKASHPSREEYWYSLARQRELVAEDVRGFGRGTRFVFGAFAEHELIGRAALSVIVRGAVRRASLGYQVDADYSGQGIATRTVAHAIDYGFGAAGLHRIQAAVRPSNEASARVLEKLGFRFEGPARRELDSAWQEDRLYAVTAEEWPPGG